MKYGNLTLGQIEALVNKLGGQNVVTSILCGVVEVIVTVISYITHTFTVLVDETKTVEELITEGKYDWISDGITSKNFALSKERRVEEKEISLFLFPKRMTSEEVITEMEKVGYRPATIWELLSLGRVKPDLQREFPVIALGSFCILGDNCRVVGLYGGDDRRRLYLRWFGSDWGGTCRFVGVCK